MFDIDTFGKLKDISRFDAPFFNFSDADAHQSAPDVRIMLEVCHNYHYLVRTQSSLLKVSTCMIIITTNDNYENNDDE